MTCEYSEFIERLLTDQSKEEDKLIESYHKQIKKLNYLNCLIDINRLNNYMVTSFEHCTLDNYSDEEEVQEFKDYWEWTPKNIFVCINFLKTDAKPYHLVL